MASPISGSCIAMVERFRCITVSPSNGSSIKMSAIQSKNGILFGVKQNED
ncbi:hypothetical protein [Exiguobacterium sp.]|nr:hypothetical protein [Exiguobacterium sp.]